MAIGSLWTYPLRKAVVSLERGSLLRSLSVLLIKQAAGGRPRLPRGLAQVCPLDRPDLTFVPCDSMVLDAVYWFGMQGYEGLMSQVWPLLCRNAGDVLEIGGNIGFYGVLGGKSAGGAYTVVEPVPAIAALLQENLQNNGLAARVTLLQAAAIAGQHEAVVDLQLPDEGRQVPVGAYIAQGSELSDGRLPVSSLKVRGLPMSQLAAGRDLIKIDAEGLEESLLRSIEPDLLDTRPTLVLEVLPTARSLAAFVRRLALQADMVISVIPAYGTQRIERIAAEQFTEATPARFRSKDIVVSTGPMARLLEQIGR